MLTKFAMSGVPVYVIFPPGESREPIVFEGVITQGMVLEKLGEAAKRSKSTGTAKKDRARERRRFILTRTASLPARRSTSSPTCHGHWGQGGTLCRRSAPVRNRGKRRASALWNRRQRLSHPPHGLLCTPRVLDGGHATRCPQWIRAAFHSSRRAKASGGQGVTRRHPHHQGNPLDPVHHSFLSANSPKTRPTPPPAPRLLLSHLHTWK